MNMRIRHAVTAALLLGAAGSASAFDITGFTGTPLYVGGSTAIDKALLAFFEQTADTSSPCVTTDPVGNPIDVYTGTQAGIKFVAVACTANAANTGAVADAAGHIVFIKEDNGGSGNGIAGVGAPGGTPLTFPAIGGLTIAGGTPNCDTSAKAAVAGVTAAFNAHACAAGYGSIAAQLANFGFADVEAAIFPFDPVALDLTQQNTIDIVFAPAVSLGLYHALQKAQGLTPGDLTADIPSLSTATLSSIFTGKVTTWANVVDANGAISAQTSLQFGTSGGAAHEFNGGAPGNPASTKIFLCRRDINSGTQKTSEIVFGGNNCVGGNVGFRSDGAGDPGSSWTQPASVATIPNTFSGASTGAVLNCLQGVDQLGGFAIGYASVDNGWGSKGTTNATTGIGTQDFRYVKVDGAVSSIENAASGKYKYWAQSSLYLPGAGGGHNKATGDALIVQNYLTGVTNVAAGIGSAAAIGALDVSNQWSNGPIWDGGVLAIPGNVGNATNAATATTTTFRGNPVNDYVKANGGNNNCQPQVLAAGAKTSASGTVSWTSP